MERYIAIITILLYLCPVCGLAQEGKFSGKDSVSISGKSLIQADTLRIDSLGIEKMKLTSERFKPNSKKAVIYSAIIPGLGQIYNRKYWKLPFVYGSFMGCAYAITWNGTQYNGYRNAYLDFISGDPNRYSWENYLYGAFTKDTTTWGESTKSSFLNSLKNAKDYYRRYRDLSWIIAIGIYAAWIIDAYVDAQLFDFDISPNLSMRIEPVMFDRTACSNRTIGMQFSFAF